MRSSIGLMLLLQVALIALNAIFACAEIAVISMNDAKLEKLASQGDKRAKRLVKLTSQPARFLSTIQVAITLSGFLGSAFAADNFSDVLVDWLIGLGVGIPRATLESIAVIVITLILSYFTLIFGELVPKRVAQRKSEKLALAVSGIISAIATAFKPVVWLLTASTNGVLRLLGIDPNEEDEEVSEEEIRMMVDVGSEKGTIDHQEKEFIQNVFEFDDLTAEEIATHRTDVELLNTEDSMEEWEKTIHETRHTLYPVCEGSADEIVGVLNAKDYFRLKDKSREKVMAEAVTPAYFVPENVKADVLFRNMKLSRSKLAVVLDEYGGMVGIVTLNDLIEQLVGEIEDEDEVDEVIAIEKVEDYCWKLHGNVELEDIEDATGKEIGDEENETFTGLIFNALGMIPDDGPQNIELEIAGLKVQVLKVENHQIAEAIIRTEPDAPAEEE
ncbi:MAG: HlyC/CorC family transporter [Clostridia bacterium]|nr:HlyC/CorC family transporter [Clostridia bacterium]